MHTATHKEGSSDTHGYIGLACKVWSPLTSTRHCTLIPILLGFFYWQYSHSAAWSPFLFDELRYARLGILPKQPHNSDNNPNPRLSRPTQSIILFLSDQLPPHTNSLIQHEYFLPLLTAHRPYKGHLPLRKHTNILPLFPRCENKPSLTATHKNPLPRSQNRPSSPFAPHTNALPLPPSPKSRHLLSPHKNPLPKPQKNMLPSPSAPQTTIHPLLTCSCNKNNHLLVPTEEPSP